MLIKNLIAEIIITVIRNSTQDENTVIPTLLQNAVAYIHNNFREQITLNGLARYCNVTPNYLGAQFSKKMGISFSDYLNTVRLRYACNLLDGTNLSCKEIAFACGYNSVEHFVYTFKKTCSMFKQMGVTVGALFTGGVKLSQMSGPVGIYSVVGESSKAGIQNVLYLVAFLSSSRDNIYLPDGFLEYNEYLEELEANNVKTIFDEWKKVLLYIAEYFKN